MTLNVLKGRKTEIKPKILYGWQRIKHQVLRYFQVCSNSAYPQHSGERYSTSGPLVYNYYRFSLLRLIWSPLRFILNFKVDVKPVKVSVIKSMFFLIAFFLACHGDQTTDTPGGLLDVYVTKDLKSNNEQQTAKSCKDFENKCQTMIAEMFDYKNLLTVPGIFPWFAKRKVISLLIQWQVHYTAKLGYWKGLG